MPLYIRHLPGGISKLFDEKTLPPNHVLFNPSIAFPILYLREDVHSTTKEVNSAVLLDLEKGKQYRVQSPSHLLKPNCNMFQGIEDLRICWFNDQLWFTATSTHASDNMISEMLLGYFDKNLTCVERMSYIDIGCKPVKNVCPYVHNGKMMLLDVFLMAIYEVSDVNDTDGKWVKYEVKKVTSLKFGIGLENVKYRGSTSPVHLHGNTWGCIVHDIIFNDQTVLVTRLSYIHHWIEFDIVSGVISFVSTPFWVAHWGIEYISGIQLINKHGVKLFIGVNDTSAIVCDTTLANLRVGK